jgi:hypothetical protein
MDKTKPNSKRPISERRNDILCFSDIFDNLTDFKELDIVPKSLIEEMKRDKTKICTIIEYSSSEVAVVDNTLLICHESIEKYYQTCMDILTEFQQRINGVTELINKGMAPEVANQMKASPVINLNFRTKIVNNFGLNGLWADSFDSEESAVELIKMVHSEKGYDEQRYKQYDLSSFYLKTVELASKLLLCFNGELNMAYNTRIDLIMLRVVKDYKSELEIVRLALKKFRKSYIGWFYRRLLFSLSFEIVVHKLENLYLKKGTIESKDFLELKNLWEDEYEVVVEASNQKKRSYKLWEHLSLLQLKISKYLMNLLANEEASEENRTELEIFLIETMSGYYEKAKGLCKKDVHNNCIFEYLNGILRIMHDLKIDEFMGEDDFYKNFMDDHLVWVEGLLSYHEQVQKLEKKERQKWVALTMIDYSKLESLKAHKRVVESWDEYQKFYEKIK